MTNMNSSNPSCVITAFWETNPGEESVIAELLRSFLPQAQKEPGVKTFQISSEHRKAARILLLRGVCE